MNASKKSFSDILNEIQDVHLPSNEEALYENASSALHLSFPLLEEEITDILMHREVHFDGDFDTMLEYYASECVGVCDSIETSSLQRAAILEKEMGENLSQLLLTSHHWEKIAHAKNAYSKLQEIYDVAESKGSHPLLLSDLILSEEEDPTEEIEAIVKEGKAILPSLTALIHCESFYDPLFPGYGRAPALAAHCLGKIQDPEAIAPLFEALEAGDFHIDETIKNALVAIGEPAKIFLLQVLQSRPLTHDNEKAAMALCGFAEENDIAPVCLQQLSFLDVRHHPLLAGYLVALCEKLQTPEHRQAFRELAQAEESSEELKRDMDAVIRSWKE